MRILIVSLAAAVLASNACVTARSASGVVSDRTMITQQQLEENHFQTVYEAVEAFHTNWLSTRGTDSFTAPSEVKVYVDNSLLGGPTTLRDLTTRNVTSVRWFDGVAATGRWGLGHGAGVIFVSTHRGSVDP